MLRYAFLLLLLGLFSLTKVLADETPRILEYDPSVCAASGEGEAVSRVERAVAAAESANCRAMMAAFPNPHLARVNRDHFTLDRYSFWRVNREGANLHNAPGGQAVVGIPAGFHYVQAINTSVDGWIQENRGMWLRHEDLRKVQTSSFTGFLLPAEWRHPFAIILDNSGARASLKPGEKGSAESGYVARRYRLVNIFARAEDDAGKVWYLIGPRQWIRQELVAKFAPAARPADVAGRWVAVDLFEQTLIAYQDDEPAFATVISSGRKGSETDEGLFNVWARLISDPMSGRTSEGDPYALQHVPWVMYFNRGQSLHGTYWHDSFGYRRSGGCVNLSVSDARWLYDWMLDAALNDEGELVNYVYIFSSGVYDLG